MELYLLFTLYALYVHPDTLRIFSAALPCLYADFAQHIGLDRAQQSVIQNVWHLTHPPLASGSIPDDH
jgi:hypothetical protein